MKEGKGKTELDVPGIVGIIRSLQVGHDIRLVVVERVGPMLKQGVVSTFNFARGFGEVLGSIKTLELSLELPLPATWKKAVLAGTAQDKSAAIAYARQRFPAASLLATARSRKPRDGIADSLCLAEWGRRLMLGAGTSNDWRHTLETPGDGPTTAGPLPGP